MATVRRWCKNGKFSRVIRTIKNQRRFDPDEVHEMLHPTRGKRIMVGYARVSSYDQRSDLTAQAERLSQYGCQPVIKDLGSGLNCKKPGLKRLLKLLLTGRVGASPGLSGGQSIEFEETASAIRERKLFTTELTLIQAAIRSDQQKMLNSLSLCHCSPVKGFLFGLKVKAKSAERSS